MGNEWVRKEALEAKAHGPCEQDRFAPCLATWWNRFGPKPKLRVWDAKEKYRAAIQSVLSAKLLRGNVVVVVSESELYCRSKDEAVGKCIGSTRNFWYCIARSCRSKLTLMQAGKNLSNVTVLRPKNSMSMTCLRCHSLVIPQVSWIE